MIFTNPLEGLDWHYVVMVVMTMGALAGVGRIIDQHRWRNGRGLTMSEWHEYRRRR